MHRRLVALLFTALAMATQGCATIPSEAPELSSQLGSRLTAIEVAHIRLVEQFFEEKRRQVDSFVQSVWVPAFAEEFFGDDRIEAVWTQIVASKDPQDRLRFIALVGPRLQEQINQKRSELVNPLEELERQVKLRLKVEYDQARAINNTLTAFLQSASQVEANRRRYLDALGIADNRLDDYVDHTDEAVRQLTERAKGAQDKVERGQQFVERVKSMAAKMKR